MAGNREEDVDEPEHRMLPRIFTGQRARSAMSTLADPAYATQLVFDGSEVTRVDAYGGAVLGAALHSHLALTDRSEVVINEPRSDRAWALLYDLIGQAHLPQRCAWAGNRPLPTRGREVVLPATAVVNREQVDLLTAHALPAAAGALGFGSHSARLLQEAAAAFLDNAEVHGASALPPVICAALDGQPNDLQLVVVSVDRETPEHDQSVLHAAVGKSRVRPGGFQSLVGRERGGLDLSVRLAHGRGRAHYRTGRSWHFSTGSQVAGFIAAVEVHR